MRSLASIQEIINLEPIEGADSIEVATVLGWHIVVKKGEFQVGDHCVYFEVDSLLPKLPIFEFLASRGTKKTLAPDGTTKEGYRLRTVKLRGQISQGLVFPLADFAGYLKIQDVWSLGMDVTDKLGVVKYEPPIPAELMGLRKGNFPVDIPKTDETRIQSIPGVLKRWEDEPFYMAEKVDGTSITIFYDNEAGELHVAGRTIDWDRSSDNSYWKATLAAGFDEKGKTMGDIVLQGELVGEGIQGNKLKIKGQKILFFNAMHRNTGEYMDYQDFVNYCSEMGVEHVPIIETEKSLRGLTVDQIVDLATRKSLINPEVWVEGVVFRPMHEQRDPKIGRVSFKAINPKFLLKYEE